MAKNDTLYTRKAAGMCGFQKFFSAVMRRNDPEYYDK